MPKSKKAKPGAVGDYWKYDRRRRKHRWWLFLFGKS